MKDWAKKTVLASGVLRVAASLRSRGAAVLMYHSVLPDPLQHENVLGRAAHSEAVFRGQMEGLARDFHPISLDQAWQQVRDGQDLKARTVVVTFDDGYADNYDVAAPILDAAGVPATFYATVDCIETRRLPWPSRLRFAFRNTKKRDWADLDSKIWKLSTEEELESAFMTACGACCRLSGAAQEELCERIERELDAQLPAESGSLMMNFEQLKSLARKGHIIGSHTLTHPNMAYVSEEEARREFAVSKQKLEAQLNAPVRHFAYPCPALSPHWSERTVEQCRAAGYETAVTTDRGLMRKGDNPLALKRVRPSKTVDGLRWNLENAFAGRAI